MERCDLYTSARERTGRTLLRGEPVPKGLYRLVAHTCVWNAKGEMLIQQRQSFKSTWPDLWTVSAGGHAVSGETTQETARRELKEELGLDASFSGKPPALTVCRETVFEDFYFWQLETDSCPLTLQAEEVQAVRWAARQEILDMIDEGVFVGYHKSLICLLFDLKDHPGIHSSKGMAQR